ncbi:hypothetical protein [Lentilactobacillus kisonensis]|uniref:Extracellular protein n=2 Tax=Lentilactobacillus kisonensis TaxID=481722 RepID=H1LIX6_9LACO|nr:hypothetical protein [Lentilactobacillus kisonensis]EHO49403.1 hypothetical protein HMPREF9104_02568 [Lentilactobacillus kisonensis F0435]KRL22345.1 hypothetical protein FC98_GL002479 [Lentilactobacillus kisonensis DSM 19906 = JCM 15041]
MKFLKAFLCFVLAIALGAPIVAHAKYKVYHQRSSGLYRGSLRNLNNKKVHYVRVPREYFHVSHTSKVHTIKSERGKRVTFTTRYILPLPGKNGQHWGNPQSIAMTGRKYMYIVYCPTNLRNKGRIVRFNTQMLDSLGVRLHPKELRDAYVKHHHKYSVIQRQIHDAIKVGPLFTTGHGQSLAYNWKNKGLYMWRDKERAPRVPVSNFGYIQHIKTKTLRPDHAIRFSLHSRGTRVPGGHDLTFDKSGNAYFWSFPGWGAYIFKGKIHTHSVKFRLTHQVLKHLPGTRIQSMGYNPVRKRLLMMSDASIASFPAKGLRGHGHLTNRSFEWTQFGPKREFEGIAYDGSSKGNLLVNHCPEVLQADRGY